MPRTAGTPEIIFTPEMIDQLERMSGLGMTQEHMAVMIGVSERTLQRRIADDEVVAGAIKKGKAQALLGAMDWAYKRAFIDANPETGERGNNTMAIFWLKTQAKWRDNSPVQEDVSVAAVPNVQFVLKGGLEVDDRTIRDRLAAAYDKPQVIDVDTGTTEEAS